MSAGKANCLVAVSLLCATSRHRNSRVISARKQSLATVPARPGIMHATHATGAKGCARTASFGCSHVEEPRRTGRAHDRRKRHLSQRSRASHSHRRKSSGRLRQRRRQHQQGARPCRTAETHPERSRRHVRLLGHFRRSGSAGQFWSIVSGSSP